MKLKYSIRANVRNYIYVTVTIICIHLKTRNPCCNTIISDPLDLKY